MTHADDATTAALVAYLRSEADASELRAKSMRAQAAQLAEAHGISTEMQQRYGPYESKDAL